MITIFSEIDKINVHVIENMEIKKNIKVIRFTETLKHRLSLLTFSNACTFINIVDITLHIKFHFSYPHFSMSLKILNKRFSYLWL